MASSLAKHEQVLFISLIDVALAFVAVCRAYVCDTPAKGSTTFLPAAVNSLLEVGNHVFRLF